MMLQVFVVVCFAFTVTSSFPFHASCNMQWTFTNLSCDATRGKLVDQINAWNGPTNCDQGGEKCLYSLVSNTPEQVTATHTTPKSKYVDDLTMNFSPMKAESFGIDHFQALSGFVIFEKVPLSGAKGCKVDAKSRSETWYAVLDFGTNYCNLHNLVVGSGLSKRSDFVEVTSDDVCTQYSKSNCDKY